MVGWDGWVGWLWDGRLLLMLLALPCADVEHIEDIVFLVPIVVLPRGIWTLEVTSGQKLFDDAMRKWTLQKSHHDYERQSGDNSLRHAGLGLGRDRCAVLLDRRLRQMGIQMNLPGGFPQVPCSDSGRSL